MIRINNRLTDWFSSSKGAKKGDSSSLTLFAIFINDLVKEIYDLDIGVQVGDRRVSLLYYADDIVFTATSVTDLQVMLETLSGWCKNWQVLINTSTSKCVQFRPQRHRRTEYNFTNTC